VRLAAGFISVGKASFATKTSRVLFVPGAVVSDCGSVGGTLSWAGIDSQTAARERAAMLARLSLPPMPGAAAFAFLVLLDLFFAAIVMSSLL
jgi:hypothetical protein